MHWGHFQMTVKHRIVNKFITKMPQRKKQALKHLTPLIEERLRKEKEYGKDWPGKPVGIH